MQRYLVINPFGIGDALFTMPLIGDLKDRHPDCFVGYWCNERVGELLKNDPKIDKIFALSRGDIKRIYKDSKLAGFIALFRLIYAIRKEKFDVAFDLSLDSRYGLWSIFAGIKKRVGPDYKGRGRFLTDKIKISGYSGRHVVEHNLDLLKLVDTYYRTDLTEPYDVEVSEESRERARKMLAGYGIGPYDAVIAVAPGGGASWGENAIYKQWPQNKFAEVADKLLKDLKVKVVFLGSSDEKRVTDSVVNKMKCPGAIDLTGKLNMSELAGVMSQINLLICNDGGLLHMAVALGPKTVSIFGPVDEKVYGPYPICDKHIVVKRDMPCRPCYRDFRFSGCSNNRRCLEDIAVDEVYEKIKELLHLPSAGSQCDKL